MKRTSIALTTALLAISTTLAACSSEEPTTAASPSGSLVGGMTECTEPTITQAINDVVSADDSGVSVVSLDELQCADGWAAAEATVSMGAEDGGGITETFVLEAEGQFWVPKDRAQVCGTIVDMTVRPDDAQVPAEVWALACTTN